MKLSAIRKDVAKEKAGVWIGEIPDMGDLRLKVRPIGNPDYRHLFSQLNTAVPRQFKRGGVVVDKAQKDEISARCLADTVLLDWENFEDDEGKPLPYSVEVAKQMLLDPEYAAFRDAVAWAGNVAEEEVLGVAAVDAGN